MLPGTRVTQRYSCVYRTSKLLFLLLALLFAGSGATLMGQVTPPPAYNFGPVSAGSTATQTLTFNFTASATIGSVSVVTQGAADKDFQSVANDPSATLCAGRSFGSGDSCTVDVTFSPLALGLRIGAVELLDGGGGVLAIAYISGWGQGALLVSGTAKVSTIAGIDNVEGYNYSPSNTIATNNRFDNPTGIIADPDGNVYIADWFNRIIRKVTPDGTISTIAGVQGQSPLSCQALSNAPAASTPAFDRPGGGMAIDATGNLIVGDQGLHCVYRIDLRTGTMSTVSTILGTDETNDQCAVDEFTTDGVPGPAEGVEVTCVGGVGIDGAGNIYVGSSGNLLKIDPTLYVTAVAGTGTALAYSGEGGPATSATIYIPYTIIFNAAGELLFTDFHNGRVLKIDAAGKIHTVLGGGSTNSTSLPAVGTAGSVLATNVKSGPLWGIAVDGPGNLYATATQFGEIIQVDPNGYAYIYSGTSFTPQGVATDSGDGGPPAAATLSTPTAIWVDVNGAILVADEAGNDVRRMGYAPLSTAGLNFVPTFEGKKSTDSPKTVTLENIGSQPLTYATPASGNNPSISTSFTVDPASTCQPPSANPTGTLAFGASCKYAIDFIPLSSGLINGSLDISANIFGGTVSIPLTGTGIKILDLFVVTAPATAIAGTPITVNVTAYFQGSVATNYTGPLTITSSDPKAIFPASITLIAGVGSFSATLETTGIQTFTATDVTSVTATSNNIMVTAGSAYQIIAVSGAGQSTPIGTVFANPLKVEVLDQYGNPAGGDTVSFTAPAAGPSATFAGGATCVTSTAAPIGYCSVIATANGIASPTAYNVAASVNGVANPASFSLTNTQAATVLTVTPSATSLVYGQPATVNAAISPSSVAGSVPTGNVTFYDGAANALLPNAVVSSAAASYSVTVPTVGTHNYFGKYLGDSNFAASAETAAAQALVVAKAPTTLNGPATQPVVIINGQGGTIPITVVGEFSGPGIAKPTGTLTYSITNSANVTVGSGTVPVANGAASVPVAASLLAGAYTVTVSYGGDGNYLGSTTSATISLQVSQIQPVIQWATPVPITYGATLAGILNASALNGSAVVPGSYAYSTGGKAITNATVLAANTYTLNVNFTPTDTATYKSATGSVVLVVNKAMPGVSLSSSANPTLLSNPTTLTVTVSSAVSTPTGTITFLDGTTPIGTAPVTNGVATLTTAKLAAGVHPVSATYSGDSNFLTASSTPVSQHVDDFTIVAGSVNAITILPGGNAEYQFTLTPVGDSTFPADIKLKGTGHPGYSALALDPGDIATGSGTTNLSVKITTPSLTGAVRSTDSLGSRLAPLALALLLLPFSKRMRRSARRLGRIGHIALLLILTGAALVGATGCGAKTGYFAQPQKTYTVTVTGTSGNLSHAATVTLTVE